MSMTALKPTKWLYDVAASLLKADIRLNGMDAVPKDAGVLFVANRSTRLDVLIISYAFHKWGLRDVSLIVPDDLLRGRIGAFLSTNALAIQEDSEPGKAVIRGMLEAKIPWVLFPEPVPRNARDRALPQPAFVGEQKAESLALPTPPMSAAALALRAESLRRRIGAGHEEELAAALNNGICVATIAPVADRTGREKRICCR